MVTGRISKSGPIAYKSMAISGGVVKTGTVAKKRVAAAGRVARSGIQSRKSITECRIGGQNAAVAEIVFGGCVDGIPGQRAADRAIAGKVEIRGLGSCSILDKTARGDPAKLVGICRRVCVCR